MTETPQRSPDPRQAEDDLDLLTYTEAGIRLAEEIERVRAGITIAQAAGDPVGGLTVRLTALLAAQERNSRPLLGDTSFETFFGYPATPRS